MLWCGFCKEIETRHSKDTVYHILAQEDWYSIVPDLKCIDPERFVFRICKNNKWVTDSFQPFFRLDVQNVDTSAKVFVSISAKRSTQIMSAIYSVVCAIFQIAMLGMWFRGELDFSFVLFVPIFLFLCSQILTYSALRLSARHFLKALHGTLCRKT